jgi:hypothetical protein
MQLRASRAGALLLPGRDRAWRERRLDRREALPDRCFSSRIGPGGGLSPTDRALKAAAPWWLPRGGAHAYPSQSG